MKGQYQPNKIRLKWLRLFMPEDSGQASRYTAHTMRGEGKIGDLKFWVWFAIAIGIALALGQL